MSFSLLFGCGLTHSCLLKVCLYLFLCCKIDGSFFILQVGTCMSVCYLSVSNAGYEQLIGENISKKSFFLSERNLFTFVE